MGWRTCKDHENKSETRRIVPVQTDLRAAELSKISAYLERSGIQRSALVARPLFEVALGVGSQLCRQMFGRVLRSSSQRFQNIRHVRLRGPPL
jgi:hypothetical protein